MAKTKEKETVISLVSDDNNAPRPRLSKLIIKNFRSIGENPVEIYLNDIVVLVGANNVGKSTILRAYEVAMNTGSKEGYLSIDDFPNKIIDEDKLPEIEVHTIISHNKPGDQWIKRLDNGEMLIREKWTWTCEGVAPKRQGFDVIENKWSDKVPWGAPNVANAYRPKPHRIEAFASPEEEAKKITDLVTSLIKDSYKTFKSSENTSDKSDYDLLLEHIANFQSNIAYSIDEKIKSIEESINSTLSEVFKDYVIKLDANSESSLDKTYSPFKTSPDLLMGQKDGYLSNITYQGSGARRTLLWSALKYIAENENNDKLLERPHVLLIDEPEMCLHPSAIRDARKVLYKLPSLNNWQVMVTTHSPIFIDLSCDNTTIIRVDSDKINGVRSTVLFRPEQAKLSDDDKKNLKLLNVCDPYVHEFFFGGRIIIVEGDTEYTAFSSLKVEYPNVYNNVHIIRARGKGIIPSVIKILNQFATGYGVLHDSDTEKTDKGSSNPAWKINENIMQEVNKSPYKDKTIVIACKDNFEKALLGESVFFDKPYYTFSKIKSDENFKRKVKQLMDSLLDNTIEPPDGCIKWSKIDDLK